MDEIAKTRRKVVICGDWNIAHTEKDLKNWRGNKKNSGFLPEEREWMTSLFAENKWLTTSGTCILTLKAMGTHGGQIAGTPSPTIPGGVSITKYVLPTLQKKP